MDAEAPSRLQWDFVAGEVLLVNKPEGWTSFDVVNKLRNRLRAITGVKRIKVGHAGTLDPLATGLLIICTGKATRRIDEYQGLPKAYVGSMMLGSTTASYDAETEVEERFPTDHITQEMLEQARLKFLGDIEQVPPVFSAIKVDGQPLYKKARRGERMEVQSRPVSIYTFKLTRVALPVLDFEVTCSKGTYIRSLVHDFGKALGSGAYLSALRRTAIGPHSLEQAWALDELLNALDAFAGE